MTETNVCDTSVPDASLAVHCLLAAIVHSERCAVLLFLKDVGHSYISPEGHGRAKAASSGRGPLERPFGYTGALVSMPAQRLFLCGLPLADVDLRKVLLRGDEIPAYLTCTDMQRWMDSVNRMRDGQMYQPPICLYALCFFAPQYDNLIVQQITVERFCELHDLDIDVCIELAQLIGKDMSNCKEKLPNETNALKEKKEVNGQPPENEQQQEQGQQVLKRQPGMKGQSQEECQQQVKWPQQGQDLTDTRGQHKGKDQPQEEGQQQLKGQSDEKGHPQDKEKPQFKWQPDEKGQLDEKVQPDKKGERQQNGELDEILQPECEQKSDVKREPVKKGQLGERIKQLMGQQQQMEMNEKPEQENQHEPPKENQLTSEIDMLLNMLQSGLLEDN